MCSAPDVPLGNHHKDDQAGQKLTSHILGAIFKRTGAVSPDFSSGFTASRYQECDGIRPSCGILDWGRLD